MLNADNVYNGYDFETFAVNTGLSDVPIVPTHVPLRIICAFTIDTDQPITLKFDDGPDRPLTPANSPLQYNGLGVNRITVSNASGSTANISVDVIGIKA